MATPIAAKVGLPALLFVRACMGVGEVRQSSHFYRHVSFSDLVKCFLLHQCDVKYPKGKRGSMKD